jgi:hypothetical protein
MTESLKNQSKLIIKMENCGSFILVLNLDGLKAIQEVLDGINFRETRKKI